MGNEPETGWRESIMEATSSLGGEIAVTRSGLNLQIMKLRADIASVRDRQLAADENRAHVNAKLDEQKTTIDEIRTEVATVRRIVLEGNGQDSHKQQLRDHDRRITAIESEKVTAAQDAKDELKQRRTQRRGVIYAVGGTLAASLILSIFAIVWADHKAAQSVVTNQTSNQMKADKSAQLSDADIQRIVDAAVKKATEAKPVEVNDVAPRASRPRIRGGKRYDMSKPQLFHKLNRLLEAKHEQLAHNNLADVAPLEPPPGEKDR